MHRESGGRSGARTGPGVTRSRWAPPSPAGETLSRHPDERAGRPIADAEVPAPQGGLPGARPRPHEVSGLYHPGRSVEFERRIRARRSSRGPSSLAVPGRLSADRRESGIGGRFARGLAPALLRGVICRVGVYCSSGRSWSRWSGLSALAFRAQTFSSRGGVKVPCTRTSPCLYLRRVRTKKATAAPATATMTIPIRT